MDKLSGLDWAGIAGAVVIVIGAIRVMLIDVISAVGKMKSDLAEIKPQVQAVAAQQVVAAATQVVATTERAVQGAKLDHLTASVNGQTAALLAVTRTDSEQRGHTAGKAEEKAEEIERNKP